MPDSIKIAQMPCGFRPTGSLQDLGHYRKCAHKSCKSRASAWDALKQEAATPIKSILEKKRAAL